MKNNRRHQVKLYPNDFVRSQFELWEQHCRFLHNLSIEQHKLMLTRGKFIDYHRQSAELVDLKNECPWLKQTPAWMLQAVLKNVERAYKHKYKKIACWPRFKKKGRDDVCMQLTTKNSNLKNGFLKLPKVGWIKFRGSKEKLSCGQLKSLNLIKRAGDWYASLLFEIDDTKKVAAPENSIVAFDRGVTHLLASSSGELIDNPRHFERSMKKLVRQQRALSRRKKGSKRYEKQRSKVTRSHLDVANQRRNFLHQLSHDIAKNHGIVVLENLKPSRMVHFNRGLSRSILDAGWSMLQQMLKYKLKERGGQLVLVDPAYTSQTCNRCGYVNSVNRKRKQFSCLKCSHEDDADINAAKNILAVGQMVIARGGNDARDRLVKREAAERAA